MTVTTTTLVHLGGGEVRSTSSSTPSFTPCPTVVSSDQPFPQFSVRRYAELASERASVAQMEDGRYFAELELIEGAWGEGATPDEALHDFVEAVFHWVIVKMDQRHGDIPMIGTLDLNIL